MVLVFCLVNYFSVNPDCFKNLLKSEFKKEKKNSDFKENEVNNQLLTSVTLFVCVDKMVECLHILVQYLLEGVIAVNYYVIIAVTSSLLS